MNNLYLISGDESYEKEIYIEKIKESFGELVKGINYITLDKDTINNLTYEISTYPFGCNQKLIIVKCGGQKTEDEGKKTNWVNDELIECLNGDLENVCVVFVEEGNSKGKLSKIISEKGKCISFNMEKSKDLVEWVVNFCTSKGKNITKNDTIYFLEVCGNSKQILANELDKIIDYVGDNKNITKEVIDNLCIKSSDIIIFDLTDSIGKKQTKKALESLEELLENKEPLQKIVIMIGRHFKTLLMVKEVLKQRKNVVTELGIKQYPAMKYSEQSRNFTEEELILIIKQLAKLDADSKVGKIDLKVGLQSIICK